MANAPDAGQAGPFEFHAFWDVLPKTATGTLTVYEASARDGSSIHVVKVPIKFAPHTSMTHKIFYVPESALKNDCSLTKSVAISMPGSARPAELTLNQLLGVDSSDTPAGLTTMIPDRTHLLSLSVTNGVATAIFDSGLERDGGGSCRVTAIRAQIEKTLMQFSSIKKVVISVQGKTPETTLQP